MNEKLVLVRAPNWLGDAVMALPALDELVRAVPDRRVVVAARPGVADVFTAHPRVDAWVDAAAMRRGVAKALRPVHTPDADERLARVRARLDDPGPGGRRGRFPLGLLWTNSFSTAWALWRTGARRRVGFARDGRRWLLTDAIPCPESVRRLHMVDFYRRVTRAADGRSNADAQADNATWMNSADDLPPPPFDAPARPWPRLYVADAGRAEAERSLVELGVQGPYAVFAPLSAYGAVKDWAPSRYAELARRTARNGLTVVLAGSPGQEAACEAIQQEAGTPGVVNGAGRTSAAGFLGLLAGATLFVGGDSGGTHAAAALGVRTVSIFGLTELSRSRPLGADVRVVGAGGTTLPDLRDAATRARARAVLDAIPVDEVESALRTGGALSPSCPSS